ncbi:hypothetical protein [Lentibacillus cibarius]|uniref:hypothetical protein n=1 Tax=Lentibacillus cibarius TaxID=2583219 RepID=UPI0015A2B05B|nr:hypothetical protein [Lentibacillus cibarius]
MVDFRRLPKIIFLDMGVLLELGCVSLEWRGLSPELMVVSIDFRSTSIEFSLLSLGMRG